MITFRHHQLSYLQYLLWMWPCVGSCSLVQFSETVCNGKNKQKSHKRSTSSMKLQGGAFNISKPTYVWLKVQALSMNLVE